MDNYQAYHQADNAVKLCKFNTMRQAKAEIENIDIAVVTNELSLCMKARTKHQFIVACNILVSSLYNLVVNN